MRPIASAIARKAKLRLGPIADENPVRRTAELPAAVRCDLQAYATVLGRETGQAIEAAQLVAPMLARFMATDRAFSSSRRLAGVGKLGATATRDINSKRDERHDERG